MCLNKKFLPLLIIIPLLLLNATGCNNAQKEEENPQAEITNTSEEPTENNDKDDCEYNDSESEIDRKKQDEDNKSLNFDKNKNNNKIKVNDSNNNPERNDNVNSSNDNSVQPHVHSYVESIVAQPTCTQNGRKIFTCSGCGESYSEEIGAIGHSFGDWIGNENSHSHTCTRCGVSETQPHAWSTAGECTTCRIIDFR